MSGTETGQVSVQSLYSHSNFWRSFLRRFLSCVYRGLQVVKSPSQLLVLRPVTPVWCSDNDFLVLLSPFFCHSFTSSSSLLLSAVQQFSWKERASEQGEEKREQVPSIWPSQVNYWLQPWKKRRRTASCPTSCDVDSHLHKGLPQLWWRKVLP